MKPSTDRQREALIQTRLQERLEKGLIRVVVVLIDNRAKAAAQNIEIGSGLVGIDIALKGHQEEIFNVLSVHYRKVFKVFGERAFKFLKVNDLKLEFKDEISEFTRLTIDWINSIGGDKAVRISDTTKRQIREALIKGQEEGESLSVIAKRIREETGGLIARKRSLVIARTETHNAAMAAQDSVLVASNLEDLEREWITVEDARVRPSHIRANGQRRKIGDPFVVGGARLERPGDPRGPAEEVINCRCVLAPVVEGAIPEIDKKPIEWVNVQPDFDADDLGVSKARAQLNALGIGTVDDTTHSTEDLIKLFQASQIGRVDVTSKHTNLPYLRVMNAVGSEVVRLRNAGFKDFGKDVFITNILPNGTAKGMAYLPSWNPLGDNRFKKIFSIRDPVIDQGEAAFNWRNEFGKSWSVSTKENSIAGTIRHEIGHTLTSEDVIEEFIKLRESRIFELPDGRVNFTAWGKRNLTDYSSSNGWEFIAESFAEYTSPNYQQGTFHVNLERVLDKMAKNQFSDKSPQFIAAQFEKSKRQVLNDPNPPPEGETLPDPEEDLFPAWPNGEED